MARSNDPHDLQRFVDAQNPVFEQARAELRAGRKQTHWMWFVFPQLRGLGHSEIAIRFAIGSRDEAAAYLKHPLLGPRLTDCTRLVAAVESRSIEQIFGYPDNLKFHSSMTLFGNVAPEKRVFNAALEKYFAGTSDGRTLALLDPEL